MASVYEQFLADQRLSGPKQRPSDGGRFYYDTAEKLAQRISYEDLQYYVGEVSAGKTHQKYWRAWQPFANKYGVDAGWLPLQGNHAGFGDYLVPYLSTWTAYRQAEQAAQQQAQQQAEAQARQQAEQQARQAEAARKAAEEAARKAAEEAERTGQRMEQRQGASRQRGDARQPTVLTGPTGAGVVDVLVQGLLGGAPDQQAGRSDMRRLLGG